MLRNTYATFEAQFIKKLSKTEAKNSDFWFEISNMKINFKTLSCVLGERHPVKFLFVQTSNYLNGRAVSVITRGWDNTYSRTVHSKDNQKDRFCLWGSNLIFMWNQPCAAPFVEQPLS